MICMIAYYKNEQIVLLFIYGRIITNYNDGPLMIVFDTKPMRLYWMMGLMTTFQSA